MEGAPLQAQLQFLTQAGGGRSEDRWSESQVSQVATDIKGTRLS